MARWRHARRDVSRLRRRRDAERHGGAAQVLQTLLALDEAKAGAAAAHFRDQMTAQGPPFMMKAMGLRTAVTSGREEEMSPLLAECFGLAGEDLVTSIAALRQRYAP